MDQNKNNLWRTSHVLFLVFLFKSRSQNCWSWGTDPNIRFLKNIGHVFLQFFVYFTIKWRHQHSLNFGAPYWQFLSFWKGRKLVGKSKDGLNIFYYFSIRKINIWNVLFCLLYRADATALTLRSYYNQTSNCKLKPNKQRSEIKLSQ